MLPEYSTLNAKPLIILNFKRLSNNYNTMRHFTESLEQVMVDNVRLMFIQMVNQNHPSSMFVYVFVGLLLLKAMNWSKRGSSFSIEKMISNMNTIYSQVWVKDNWSKFRVSNVFSLDTLRILTAIYRKKQVTLTGKYVRTMSTYMSKVLYTTTSFSNNFVAVAEHIMANCMSDPELHRICECAFQLHAGTVSDRHADRLKEQIKTGDEDMDEKDIKEHSTGNKTAYFIDQAAPILLDKTLAIYCSVRTAKDEPKVQKDENAENEMTTITFEIYSYSASLSEVKGFVDRLCADYLKKENDHRKNKKFIYTYDKEDTWDETEFLSTKTFDNLFFDGKEEIMKKIDFFLNNREWYEKNGIPYTLGIGLYGPPGTGKTSFIKALANYVGRHVVSLPLKMAKTKSALDKMYYEDTYSKATVPFDKKIIVMEDIDCVGKFVFQRKATDEPEVDSNAGHVLQKPQMMKYMNGNGETDSDGSDNKKFIVGTGTGTNGDERKPTLDDLLNLIDGIRENTGRILIITSNFYHKLDSALIRPGRIDITLKMDNASRQTIAQMYERYYGESIPKSILVRIPDRKYSSAEVVNFYVEHTASKEAFLECLIKDNVGEPSSPKNTQEKEQDPIYL